MEVEIDLTCWRSTNHSIYDSLLSWIRILESFFGPRATAVILKILHPFKYPGLTVCHVYLPRWQRWRAKKPGLENVIFTAWSGEYLTTRRSLRSYNRTFKDLTFFVALQLQRSAHSNVDCKYSLFCLKIRGEERKSGERASVTYERDCLWVASGKAVSRD